MKQATRNLWESFKECDILIDIMGRAELNGDEGLAVTVATYLYDYPYDIEDDVLGEVVDKAIPYVLESPEYKALFTDPDFAPFVQDIPQLVADWQSQVSEVS